MLPPSVRAVLVCIGVATITVRRRGLEVPYLLLFLHWRVWICGFTGKDCAACVVLFMT